MPGSIREVIYLGRDNTIDLILKEDDVAVDLSSVSRMVLITPSFTVDSDTVGFGSGKAFDCTEGSGKVILKLGSATGVIAGTLRGILYVYDPANTNGIRWGEIKLIIQ